MWINKKQNLSIFRLTKRSDKWLLQQKNSYWSFSTVTRPQRITRTSWLSVVTSWCKDDTWVSTLSTLLRVCSTSPFSSRFSLFKIIKHIKLHIKILTVIYVMLTKGSPSTFSVKWIQIIPTANGRQCRAQGSSCGQYSYWRFDVRTEWQWRLSRLRYHSTYSNVIW
jgi:hypothetical protein